jgi:hypothetical protein
MVTLAVADLLVSAALVAEIETLPPDGTLEGAWYPPELEIVPRVEFPPDTPFTAHVTVELVVPLTDAVNV